MSSPKKESFRFDAYVPILVWFVHFNEYEPHKRTKLCLEDINNDFKEVEELIGSTITKIIRIELLDKIPKTIEKIFHSKRSLNPQINPTILMKLSFKISRKEMDKLYPHIIKREDKGFTLLDSKLYFVMEEFRDLIKKLIFSINLSRPGTLTTDNGIVICDGASYQDIEGIKPPLKDFIPENLPPLFDLDIRSTWEWFANYCRISMGKSCSRFERALHAYSYLFKHKERPSNAEKILWSILGVEALYKKHREEIVKQIFENMQKEIGYIFSKKKIDKLYNDRSRFMHGDRDLFFNREIIELSDPCEDYTWDDELTQAADEMIYMLTYSLQKKIQEQLPEN